MTNNTKSLDERIMLWDTTIDCEVFKENDPDVLNDLLRDVLEDRARLLAEVERLKPLAKEAEEAHAFWNKNVVDGKIMAPKSDKGE